MSEQLHCLVCGKPDFRKHLAILTKRGLDTLLKCSVQRNDDLQSRIKTNGTNAVHQKCRFSYIKSFDKTETADLNSSVDCDLDSENDLVQKHVEVTDNSSFNFTKLCFICAKKCAESTNFNKVNKI